MKKIGFIINPIASLGGRAGFKGSDCIENQNKALEMGYEKLASKRAQECLNQIKHNKDVLFFTPTGELGEDIIKDSGLNHEIVVLNSIEGTSKDTLSSIKLFTDLNVDLIVFCGGDGTARDICSANIESIPVLGVPSGVKMYSGCFAVNPRLAGTLLNDYLEGHSVTTELREVMDIDEAILGTHGNSPKLYGYLPTLSEGTKLQNAKSVSTTTNQESEIMAEYLIENMLPDTLYLIGPGSTTFKIKESLNIDGTLLGVDVILNRKMLTKDADEKTLLKLFKTYKKTKIIVTCIGGAGFVFGRGNQQISPDVIRLVGKENIQLAVTKSKLAGLWQRPMLVDTGDTETDKYLSGYYRIDFSQNESAMYRLGTG